jgi:glutamine---fructose-6-phosphate transaminase (isomerizing)
VDLASEFRYREPVVGPTDLVVGISQSGETADTLAAMKEAKSRGARTLAICNVVDSAIARSCEGTLYTHAGPEIGVASTKCFTAQLAALSLLAIHIGRRTGALSDPAAAELILELLLIPHKMSYALQGQAGVKAIAEEFKNAKDFLYLGRGTNYPIALEGALKLKEISYIHAEGYAAGEMKHGPIALIDEQMPVVALAPHDHVYEKMIGTMQEAKARGGSVIALTMRGDNKLRSVLTDDDDFVVELPTTPDLVTPIVAVVPLQLLAYYIAVRRGCDVDQPRNLAKSVTVE